jgi:hypothetical protein
VPPGAVGELKSMSKSRRNALEGDDHGIRPARPPFSFIRYWGKIFLGLMFLLTSVFTLLALMSRVKSGHDTAADLVRLVSIGMSGAIALTGVLFIRWAFAERDRTK